MGALQSHHHTRIATACSLPTRCQCATIAWAHHQDLCSKPFRLPMPWCKANLVISGQFSGPFLLHTKGNGHTGLSASALDMLQCRLQVSSRKRCSWRHSYAAGSKKSPASTTGVRATRVYPLLHCIWYACRASHRLNMSYAAASCMQSEACHAVVYACQMLASCVSALKGVLVRISLTRSAKTSCEMSGQVSQNAARAGKPGAAR